VISSSDVVAPLAHLLAGCGDGEDGPAATIDAAPPLSRLTR
jgi:hypothetical protein